MIELEELGTLRKFLNFSESFSLWKEKINTDLTGITSHKVYKCSGSVLVHTRFLINMY